MICFSYKKVMVSKLGLEEIPITLGNYKMFLYIVVRPLISFNCHQCNDDGANEKGLLLPDTQIDFVVYFPKG